MKKLLAVAVLSCASTVSFADQDVGCGLGTIIWAGQSGLLPKVLAATTNGMASQTLAISTGTLGCQKNGVITSRVRLTMFTGSNIEKLAQEMSVGQGESLNVLADLMGVTEADKPVFFQATRSHFGEIFAPANATAGDVLNALDAVMARDERLSAYTTKA